MAEEVKAVRQTTASASAMGGGREAAEHLPITQSLTGIIDGLESKGLAKRLSHPKDHRKIKVQITPKGRSKYGEAAAHSDETAETYFKTLTAGERSQLRKALLKLRGGAYPLLGLRHDAA